MNYFRDVDPATGRYLESDLIGLAAGVNTYAALTVDPLGLFMMVWMVFVSYSYGIGGHAWVYMTRGSDRVRRFAGGFKAEMSGDLQILFDKDADIPGYRHEGRLEAGW